MATSVIIEVEGTAFNAEINDSPGAQKFLDLLPLSLRLSRWGDEYYGGCGAEVEEDSSAREFMEIGEIALWPPGNALCLFFGPTPASTDDRPKAASPVVPIGRIIDNPKGLAGFGGSVQVTVRPG